MRKETTKMTINNIKNALRVFGAKGTASAEYITEDRILVKVNGEFFGIWDAEKNTFVA